MMPNMDNYRRKDIEEMMAVKAPRMKVVFTGDTDPKFERDELMCGRTPSAFRVRPDATITFKMCNTYKAPTEPPELRGLSIEAAKKKIVGAGFIGKIEVLEQYDYDKDCPAETVCSVTPHHWELNQDRSMTIYINKRVKITTPD